MPARSVESINVPSRSRPTPRPRSKRVHVDRVLDHPGVHAATRDGGGVDPPEYLAGVVDGHITMATR
jgi:hypothetical protein